MDASISSLHSFQPMSFLVFNLHAETEGEKRNLIEAMHASLWEGSMSKTMGF